MLFHRNLEKAAVVHSEEVERIMTRLSAIAAMIGQAETEGGVDPDMLAALELEAETLNERLEDLGYSLNEPSQST